MHRLPGGVTAAIVFMLTFAASARAQTIDVDDLRVELTGRVQVQFNTTSVDEDDIGERFAWSTFETRRIRLGVDLIYGDWMTGKIEPDFAQGDLSLKDAWIGWGFDDAFHVRFGQFKKPFSRIELISSTQILPIERGVRIRGLDDALALEGGPVFHYFDDDLVFGDPFGLVDVHGYSGRDLGVSVHGAFGRRLGYAIGIFNGSGADRLDGHDGKSIAGRLAYEPASDLPLSLGVGVSYVEDRVEDFLGTDLEVHGTAFELDAEWGAFRRPGWHAVLEGAIGDNLVADEPFLAGQAWLAYFHPVEGRRVEGVEPLLRLGYGDPDTRRDDDHGILLTPGLNLYFFGRNRFMVNWDVFFSGLEGVDTQHALRAQAQVYF